MNDLVGTVLGGLIGLGMFVIVLGIRGVPSRGARRQVARGEMPDRMILRGSLAATALVVVWLATGWPAGAVMAAVGSAALPSLMGIRARRSEAVARIEAIATWAELLRDVMAAAAGLQEAIVATGPLAPAPIRPEVQRLAHRISTPGQRLTPALRAFADELAHPLGDMVVTSLLLASERQGRMGDLLGEVAVSARKTVAMRLRVEATRARTYVTTRLIVGITVLISVWLIGFRRDYLAPFDSPGGQVMLVLIGSIFCVAGVLMHRMATPTELARLLGGEGDE